MHEKHSKWFHRIHFCLRQFYQKNLSARIRTGRPTEAICEHNRWHTNIFKCLSAKRFGDGFNGQPKQFNYRSSTAATIVTERAQALRWETINFRIGKSAYIIVHNRNGVRKTIESLSLFRKVKDICNELDVRSLCHKILQNVSILLKADRGSLFLVQGKCTADGNNSDANKK